MEMIIRKLRGEDAAILQECRLFGLRESAGSLLLTYGEVAGTPLSRVEEELADEDTHWLGAFDGDALVGFMRYVRFRRQARRHVAEVRSVYVKGAARGQGVGARLLRQIIADAKVADIESLILSVLVDNTAARQLYQSFGFRLYGTEPRAVRKGDTCIGQCLYELDLSEACRAPGT